MRLRLVTCGRDRCSAAASQEEARSRHRPARLRRVAAAAPSACLTGRPIAQLLEAYIQCLTPLFQHLAAQYNRVRRPPSGCNRRAWPVAVFPTARALTARAQLCRRAAAHRLLRVPAVVVRAGRFAAPAVQPRQQSSNVAAVAAATTAAACDFDESPRDAYGGITVVVGETDDFEAALTASLRPLATRWSTRRLAGGARGTREVSAINTRPRL